jgi:hypothetical protein
MEAKLLKGLKHCSPRKVCGVEDDVSDNEGDSNNPFTPNSPW